MQSVICRVNLLLHCQKMSDENLGAEHQKNVNTEINSLRRQLEETQTEVDTLMYMSPSTQPADICTLAHFHTFGREISTAIMIACGLYI